MKLWALAIGGIGLLSSVAAPVRHDRLTIAVSGNTLGYLSPCGCTQPMSGGITRRASALRGLVQPILYLDNGRLLQGSGRQELMKAQTALATLMSMGVAAIHFTPDLASLSKGDALSLTSLAPGKFVSCQAASEELGVVEALSSHGFLITGASIAAPNLQSCLAPVLREVTEPAILLLDGAKPDAVKLATQFPQIVLVVYNSHDPEYSTSASAPLLSPGDKGRYLARLGFEQGSMGGYQAIELDPGQPSDAQAMAIYKQYLKRVDSSNLLEQFPRLPTVAFAGTAACGACHGRALDVWRHSGHSHALRTLIDNGHGRDPECVPCHVVRLDSTRGFKSVQSTPQLANVGCESCHGPGAAHAKRPYLRRLAAVVEQDCVKCHTSENSPRFEFKSYWQRIKH